MKGEGRIACYGDSSCASRRNEVDFDSFWSGDTSLFLIFCLAKMFVPFLSRSRPRKWSRRRVLGWRACRCWWCRWRSTRTRRCGFHPRQCSVVVIKASPFLVCPSTLRVGCAWPARLFLKPVHFVLSSLTSRCFLNKTPTLIFARACSLFGLLPGHYSGTRIQNSRKRSEEQSSPVTAVHPSPVKLFFAVAFSPPENVVTSTPPA